MVSLTEPVITRSLKVAIPSSSARTWPPAVIIAVVPETDAETVMFLLSPMVMRLPNRSSTPTTKLKPAWATTETVSEAVTTRRPGSPAMTL